MLGLPTIVQRFHPDRISGFISVHAWLCTQSVPKLPWQFLGMLNLTYTAMTAAPILMHNMSKDSGVTRVFSAQGKKQWKQIESGRGEFWRKALEKYFSVPPAIFLQCCPPYAVHTVHMRVGTKLCSCCLFLCRWLLTSANRQLHGAGVRNSFSSLGKLAGKAIYQVGQKNKLFLGVDNLVVVNGRKACDMSKVTEFCLEKE